jgi:hypothetical protein
VPEQHSKNKAAAKGHPQKNIKEQGSQNKTPKKG